MKLFCSLIVLICSIFELRAQKESIWSPTFKHYTVNDGLAQSQVMCIMQDSRGYIWMGTKGGISKFNGERFENFYTKDSIPRYDINNILEDGEGMIWAFAQGECGYYDGVHWKRILRKQITNVKKINNELIGFSQRDTALYTFKTSGATGLKKFSADELNITQISNKRRNSCFFEITYGDMQMQYQYDTDHGIELIAKYNFSEILNLINNSNSHSLNLIENGDRCYYNPLSPNSKNIDVTIPMPTQRPTMEYMNYLHSGSMQLLAFNNKVYKLNASGDGYEELINTGVSIVHIMIANDNSIWCGTENGAFQISSTEFKYISDKLLPQPWSIIEGNNHNYFIGCYSHGIKQLSNDIISDVYLPPTLFKNKMNSQYFYFGAAKDKSRNLYFDNIEYALKLNSKNQWSTIKGFKTLDPKLDVIPLINYYDSIGDKMLFGMRKGVAMLDCASDNMSTIFLDSIERGFIFSITMDINRNYWFGGYGLSRIMQ